MDSQAADGKSDSQSDFQAGGSLQVPDDGDGQSEHDDVGDDIGEAAPDEEQFLVDADGAGQCGLPVGGERNARDAGCHEVRDRLRDQHAHEDVDDQADALLREKEATVEGQDG